MPSSLRKSLKAASPEPAAPDQIKGKGKSDGSMQKGQVTDNGEGNSSASMPKGNSDVSKGKSNSANASTPQGKGKSEDSKGKSNSDASTPEGKGKGKSEDSTGKGKDKGSKGKSNSDASTPQGKGKGKSEDSIGKGNSGVNQITPLQVFEEVQLLHQKVDRLAEKIDMLLLLANESAAANSAAPASGSMATLVAPTPIVPKAAPWQCQLPLVPVGHFSMLPPGMGPPPPPPEEPPRCKYIGRDWCQAFFIMNKRTEKIITHSIFVQYFFRSKNLVRRSPCGKSDGYLIITGQSIHLFAPHASIGSVEKTLLYLT